MLRQVLLFLVTTPTYVLLLSTKVTPALTNADLIFSSGWGFLVFLAFYADGQQWSELDHPFSGFWTVGHVTDCISAYHSAKKEYQDTAKVPRGFSQRILDRGFNTTGLWAYSRHPNFTAEQSVWVLLYGWSCWVTKTSYNWSIIGALLYLILFQASTWFTELISAKKYPEYKEYQKRVGKFLPRLPGGPPGDFSDKRDTKLAAKK